MARPIQIQLEKLDGHEGVRILSELTSDWFKRTPGASYKALSKAAGLAPGTVSKIHSRETIQPRLTTVVMLLKCFGFVAARFD